MYDLNDAQPQTAPMGELIPDGTFAKVKMTIRPGGVNGSTPADVGLLKASQSILFEPNPVAIEVLKSNMHINGLRKLADMSFLGLGLSDTAATGLSIRARARNLGAAVTFGQGLIGLAAVAAAPAGNLRRHRDRCRRLCAGGPGAADRTGRGRLDRRGGDRRPARQPGRLRRDVDRP